MLIANRFVQLPKFFADPAAFSGQLHVVGPLPAIGLIGFIPS